MNDSIPSRTLRITAVGDVMLGDEPVCFGLGIRSRYAPGGYHRLIEDPVILSAIQESDLALANFECTLNPDPEMHFSRHVMAAEPGGIRYLRELGVDVCTLANNHTLENGEEGLQQLVECMEEHGIAPAGHNQLQIIEKKGHRIAILAYTDVPDYKNSEAIGLWSTSRLSDVQKIAKSVDVTIVCMHWGNEFIDMPSKSQVETGRALIDAGATIVFGTHPHVLQPLERYRRGIIVYSAGNFIFDQTYLKAACHTAVFQFSIDFSTGQIDSHYIPAVISPSSYAIRQANTLESSHIRSILDADIRLDSDEDYRERVFQLRSQFRCAVLVHLMKHWPRLRNKREILSWLARRAWFVLTKLRKERRQPDVVYS